jgi:beta-lactamase class A
MKFDDAIKNRRFRGKNERVLFAVLVVIFFSVLMTLQASYLTSKALPFSQVTTQKRLGVKNLDAAVTDAKNEIYSRKIEIIIGKQRHLVSYADAGISIDEKQLREDMSLSGLMKYVPILPFALGAKTEILPSITKNQQQIELLASELAQRNRQAVADASIAIEDTKVVIKDGKSGYKIDTKDVYLGMASFDPFNPKPIVIKSVEIPSSVRKEQLETAAVKAQKIIDSKVSVLVDDTLIAAISSEQIAQTVHFVSDSNGDLDAVVEPEKSKNLLQPIAEKAKTPAGTTIIKLTDGSETSRVEGSVGKKVDVNSETIQLAKWLQLAAGGQFKIRTQDVQPATTFERLYTRSEAGFSTHMSAYLNEKYPNYSVQVQEVGGANWKVSFNENKSYYMASLYKLFVAQMAAKKIEAGELQWDTTLSNGKTVDQAFQAMLIRSEDDPAHALIDRLGGYSAVSAFARSQGFESTALSPSLTSTTADVNEFFLKLYAGSLVSRDAAERMTRYMSQNIYRQGIFKGSVGEMFSKSGVLDGNVHDAGVVKSAGKIYAITVMSQGGWSGIEDIARQSQKWLIDPTQP